jgi:hypothetical protein
MDKASSDYLKIKVRVRWYSSAHNDNPASLKFLEIKRKDGTNRAKKRVILPESSFQSFGFRGYTSEQIMLVQRMVQKLDPTLRQFRLFPSLSVSYDRQRFTEGTSGSRISLDTGISCHPHSPSLAFGKTTIQLEQSVLEVKGENDSLPYVLRAPLTGLLEKTAFSKYYECYKKLSLYTQ